MPAPTLRFAMLALAAWSAWPATLPAQPAAKPRTYLFCFWNVENFFDDRADGRKHEADRAFDDYFARDKEALRMKLERVCDVLLSKEMNNGHGPDILALAEIESLRVVELIKEALNKRLRDTNLHYKHAVCRDPGGLRAIATGVLSRVPVVGTGRILGRYQRILEVKLTENKHELTVIASHWTSRITDAGDGDKKGGRSGYSRVIHDDFRNAYRKNHLIDYLVCGDFNDNPSDEAVVQGLGAVGDVDKVLSLKKDDPPLMFNPFVAFEKAKKGTHYHRETPCVFDQICLSPGLLDGEGWGYVPKSATIIDRFNFRGRPDRFGGPNDRRPWRNRGASDHFPVTVQLRVAK